MKCQLQSLLKVLLNSQAFFWNNSVFSLPHWEAVEMEFNWQYVLLKHLFIFLLDIYTSVWLHLCPHMSKSLSTVRIHAFLEPNLCFLGNKGIYGLRRCWSGHIIIHILKQIIKFVGWKSCNCKLIVSVFSVCNKMILEIYLFICLCCLWLAAYNKAQMDLGRFVRQYLSRSFNA